MTDRHGETSEELGGDADWLKLGEDPYFLHAQVETYDRYGSARVWEAGESVGAEAEPGEVGVSARMSGLRVDDSNAMEVGSG